MNILLIEPDSLLAETYFKSLCHAGHTVLAAPGAQTGIIVADQINPDIVILELQLVEHSGIEFLYEFRSYPDWQNVPVIVHSQVPPAEFNTSDRLLREQMGVSKYLYKPQTSLKQLIAAIDELATIKT